MLSIANVKNAAQAEAYFTKEDYYLTKDRDTAAQWWGSGSKELGLQGRVEREVFGALLRGELPDGTVLPCKKGGVRRAATDLTFSAPKTVSIEALVHGREDVLSAHTEATKKALEYLEDNAANVRVSSGGKFHRCSSNTLVVAMFEHHTSRALDPQLHTHCLALNATKTPDGKWRALVNDDFYSHKMAAGMVYRAELARGLKDLGYDLRQTHADGRFEIASYRDEQIQSFSKRRQEIVTALGGELGDKLRDMGLGEAEAAKKANLGTRQVKRDVEPESLRALWREEGERAGIARAKRHDSHVGWMDAGATSKAAREAVGWAIEHLSERGAVWHKRDVVRAALTRRLTEVTLDDVEACFVKMQERGELVVVGRRREGQELCTTRAMLELEARAVELMQGGRERFGAVCRTDVVDASLESYGLTSGQVRSAQLVLLNTDMVVGVQGYAGTGKTTMLRAVRELAEEAGYIVRGMGVSGTAAKELQEGAGITSSTVASHLLRHRPRGSAKRELWLVDEASFLCSRDAVRLLASARSSGAKMVLLGDRDQLPAIEAGQPFAQLCKRGMRTAIMSEIVRTKNDELKKAVHQTIDKKMVSEQKAVAVARDVVQTLHKSVLEEASADARHAAVARAYLESDREGTLVLTASHKERRDLNDRIRKGLIVDGTLGKTAKSAKVFVNRDLTAAQLRCAGTYEPGDIVRVGRSGGYKSLGLEEGAYAVVRGRDAVENVLLETERGRVVPWDPTKARRVEVYREEGRELRVGDRIRWTRTDKDLGRSNGTGAEVVGLRPEAAEAVVRLVDGSRQILDLGQDAERHWEHGYACTTHAAQGATCDKVIAHLNTRNEMLVGHEAWYVAISRARHSALVFTDSIDRLPEAISHDMRQASALEMLEDHTREQQGLQQQQQQRSTATARQEPARGDELAELEGGVGPERQVRGLDKSQSEGESQSRTSEIGDRLKAIKRDVNLVQFAVSQGYVVNAKKSTQRSAVLDRGEDKIIVSRGKDGTWMYFSVRDDQDKGTLVDFAKRRSGGDLGAVADKLERWRREHGNDATTFDIATGPSKRSPEDIQASLARMRPLDSLLYLDMRGIHQEDLCDTRFAGRLFRDDKYNAIFPHYGVDDRPVGYEIKRSEFKGFSPGGSKGVWSSNTTPRDSRLVITEAVIDAISHHKLHGDERCRYVTTGGAIGAKQMEILRQRIEEMPEGSSVVLAFDADEAGERMAGRVAGLVPPSMITQRDVPQGAKDWNEVLVMGRGMERPRVREGQCAPQEHEPFLGHGF